jgi:inner membrane transporter RhtA
MSVATAVRRRTVPASALVIGAAVSVQGGAAVAKSLFPTLGPPGVVFLRLLFGGVALWALGRASLRGRSVADLRLVVALGVVLACMNLSFYESLERLPLGIAVTVEFVGPLAVAIAGSRRAADLVWVALAGGGIALLANGGGRSVGALGLGLAALAGGFWACYILLGVRVGRVFPGTSGLAPAMLVGAFVAAPWGIASGGAHFADPARLGAGAGVGLLSSALPWSLELEAMRRLPTRVFGVLLSLEPGIAALAGFVLLGETLHLRAIAGIALVVAASSGASRTHAPELRLDA